MLLVLAMAAAPASAQLLTRPSIPWRTLATENFVFHYPAQMERWTRDVAERMEGVRDEVSALVGHAPDSRVTVLVEDPSNVSNGFALPFRGSPTLFLWPTPPDPSSSLSNYRAWGELLAVHEFAHLAHLDRPSRNPRQALLWRLLPVNIGPVARRSPRWVIEGYATYVEGRLTGSGRPSSVGRAAVLRQWALEGQLPTYEQLDGSGRYMGGNMAYLAGSAFLEWLVEGEGEESLPELWRRMSARVDRGFDAAFEGVFGAPAPELYGLFTARLTARAVAVDDSLQQRPIHGDSLVQRLGWGTGGPALSPDGHLTAITLRSATRPSRVVVWNTVDTVDTAATRRAREQLLEADPEDVPAVQRRPAPREPLHTLHPIAGRGFHSPRFLPDGRSLIVVRSVPQGDGSERPELFIWNLHDHDVRRLTHGGAISDPDPSPDATTAAGVRCDGGICDLVRVELATGEWRTMVPGSPRRTFSRPRWSPDGRQLVVSVHEGGRWRLALVPAEGGEPHFLEPDGASRYDADFVDPATLVATSEAGGIAHLELLTLDGAPPRTLTRTTGEHVRAEAAPDGQSVQFLALHARGYDLHRVEVGAAVAGTPLPFGDELWPAAPPSRVLVADTVVASPLPAARGYGLGPRRHRVLPGVATGAEGTVGSLALHGTDPVGRLSWLLQGAVGNAAAWRGVSLDGELRVLRPIVRGAVFDARHAPSTGREGAIGASAMGQAADVGYRGALLSAALARDHGTSGYRLAGGGSLGQLTPASEHGTTGRRQLAFAELASGFRWDGERRHVIPTLALHAVTGRTADTTWSRATATLGLDVVSGHLNARGVARYGRVARSSPAYERIRIGGLSSPLVSGTILDQLWAMPALPWGIAAGREAAAFRVETSLFGLRPFLAGYAAGDDGIGAWHRVVGAEYELAVPPIAFVALPAVRLSGGVARSLDAPFQRTRGYLTITYSP